MTTITAPTIDIGHYIPPATLRRLVEQAVDEDLGRGDVTSDYLIPTDVGARAIVRARSAGVIAGLSVSQLVFELVDPATQFEALVRDGERVNAGQDLAI